MRGSVGIHSPEYMTFPLRLHEWCVGVFAVR
jgi:hypothetical protein